MRPFFTGTQEIGHNHVIYSNGNAGGTPIAIWDRYTGDVIAGGGRLGSTKDDNEAARMVDAYRRRAR